MDYLTINQDTWNKRAAIHVNSTFYDVAGFLKGNSSLNPIELQQVGAVEGKRLLHLQCHFGLDSLSWARLGAVVTGVDLSSVAIEYARRLAEQSALEATFIESDLYQFGIDNSEQFDIVFTSYGVLCWLPDLTQWAQMVADALCVGGELHLVEFHSINDLLSGYSYFPQPHPDVEEEGTYTENCDGRKSPVVTWAHSLSEVLTALISAGLTIEAFKEYPSSPYDCFEGLEYVDSAGYQLRYQGQLVPLIYSIKATKIG
ncbi:class I SAM-dependent methyltransferase [Shewanella algidipiscicola]|uniref:Type 12 methyltransferase n=1 Tax=Shewanella algidipiscicola TaxID=614070 RepID=A0ABQ4P4T1_9GAMM|nr:class I SAM-dependent methyltransferase [Shewanella algidipiscicola]GIU42537.1 type 12 methyltransferase [Shewanella algidipiscicola]